eukprot:g4264.t1
MYLEIVAGALGIGLSNAQGATSPLETEFCQAFLKEHPNVAPRANQEMNDLLRDYAPNLAVLGWGTNEFGAQEPGSDEEITERWKEGDLGDWRAKGTAPPPEELLKTNEWTNFGTYWVTNNNQAVRFDVPRQSIGAQGTINGPADLDKTIAATIGMNNGQIPHCPLASGLNAPLGWTGKDVNSPDNYCNQCRCSATEIDGITEGILACTRMGCGDSCALYDGQRVPIGWTGNDTSDPNRYCHSCACNSDGTVTCDGSGGCPLRY